MIKRIVGCGVGTLSVREEGVWGEYWVGERKGEERAGIVWECGNMGIWECGTP